MPENVATLQWEIKLGNQIPEPEILRLILSEGVTAFENSETGKGLIEFYGPVKCSTSFLHNLKGTVSINNGAAPIVSFTGLVDPDKTYPVFTFPSTLNGMTVNVERGATQNLKAKEVNFAQPTDLVNVKTDECLFMNNTYVEHVYMDTTGIVTLDEDAFNGCTNLLGVSLPGTLQKIGDRAFQGCAKINQVTLGLQVDTVGIDAFKDCSALTQLRISTPYMKTMQQAFTDSSEDLPAHIDLTLENTVIIIPSNAFSGCKALRSVTVTKNSRLSKIESYGTYDQNISSD